MKKMLILLLSLCVAITTLSSCKDNPFVLDYDASVTGDCDGCLQVNTPTSETDVLTLTLNGQADIAFHYGKPEALRTTDVNAIYVNGLKVAKPSRKQLRIAERLRQSADDKFTATVISGTYRIHFLAHITDKTTGISVTVDKTLTNRENQ